MVEGVLFFSPSCQFRTEEVVVVVRVVEVAVEGWVLSHTHDLDDEIGSRNHAGDIEGSQHHFWNETMKIVGKTKLTLEDKSME